MRNTKQVTAAGAFIFDSKHRIFLAKFAKKFERLWSIPGGKLDFGESPLEAVTREIKEETNIDLVDTEFFECGSFVVGDTHVIYVDYLARSPDDAEIRINDEFSEWGFFEEKELDSIPIVPKTKSTALQAFRKLSQRRWVDTLARYHLGLIRKTVNIQGPVSTWGAAFDWVRSQMLGFLKHAYEIEHVGSTSLADLPAKPVLDILLIYEDWVQFSKEVAALEQLGFKYRGDAVARIHGQEADPDRHFFSFYNWEENIEYVHLHALKRGHPHIASQIGFRDRLRSDPKLREDYRLSKLALQFGGVSRHDYTRAKAAFFNQ